MSSSQGWEREKFLLYGLLAITYSGIIFFLSSQPNPESVLPFAQADKLLHAIEFGLLSFVFSQTLFNSPLLLSANKVTWWALCLTLVYAITDEYHQSFVPGRNADLWDVGADLSGAILVQWAILKRL